MKLPLILLCVVLSLVAASSALNVTYGQALIPTQGGGTVQFKAPPRVFDHSTSGVEGAIKKIKYFTYGGNRYLFCKVDNGLLWISPNLSQVFPTTFYQPDSSLGQRVADYLVVNDNLFALTTVPEIRLTRYNWTSSPPSFIFSSIFTNKNPLTIPGALNGILGISITPDNSWAYIVSSDSKVVRVNITNLMTQNDQLTYPDVLTGAPLTGLTASSFYHDTANGIIWIGTNGGNIARVQISSDDFPNSAVDLYTNSDLNATFAAVVFDPQHGYVYAATAGVRGNSSKVVFLNVGLYGNQSFVEDAPLQLPPLAYGVRSFDWDPMGLMYLGTGGPPGSIYQIDLANRNYEFVYQFTDAGVQAMDDMTYDSVAHTLFVGSLDFSYNAIIYGFQAAWACELNCHSHGTCNWRNCTCNSFISARGNNFTYDQPWCGTAPCDLGDNGLSCSGQGLCVDGNCTCNGYFTGDICQTRQCLDNCTDPDHGSCDTSNNYTCNCNPGHGGDNCKIDIAFPCEHYTTCNDCMQNKTCGWCGTQPDTAACRIGNLTGPIGTDGNATWLEGCGSWHYQDCPSIGITIGTSILIAIVLLFMVINAVSFIWEDTSSQKDLEKRLQWYRYQRSGKAYLAWYVLQAYAIVTLIGVDLDTSIASFPRVLLPIVGVHGFGYGGPRSRDLQSLVEGAFEYSGFRSLFNINTALVFADTPASRLFAQVLITFLVLTGAAIVLYIILMIIFAAARGNSDRIAPLLASRPLYIFIRFLDLGYLPIVTFAAAQLTIIQPYGTTGMAILAAVVGLGVLGVGVPLAIQIVLVKVKVAELFKDNYLFKLYSFYGSINHKKIHFAFLPWARRFALGIVWGFATSSIVAQLVLSLIIQLIYIVIIFIVSPYTDYLQQFADVIVNIITLLAFVPLFAFTISIADLGAGAVAGTLIFVILTVIGAVAGIGFFIYSWCQMAGIFSLAQCKEKCCCGK